MNEILGKKILFVTAHPDDESYLAAGTMLLNHEAGGTSYVACASLGERGISHFKKKISSRQVKILRKKELLAASKYLKVAGLLLPGLPDAELSSKSNQDVLFKRLLAFAEKHRPTIMISFGKDGISGHLDHISVGSVAKKVAAKLKVRFLTFSAPPKLHKSMEELRKKRKHGKYARSLKRQPHDIEIKVDPVKKLKALQFHKSQFDAKGPSEALPARIMKQILSREYYSFTK